MGSIVGDKDISLRSHDTDLQHLIRSQTIDRGTRSVTSTLNVSTKAYAAVCTANNDFSELCCSIVDVAPLLAAAGDGDVLGAIPLGFELDMVEMMSPDRQTVSTCRAIYRVSSYKQTWTWPTYRPSRS